MKVVTDISLARFNDFSNAVENLAWFPQSAKAVAAGGPEHLIKCVTRACSLLQKTSNDLQRYDVYLNRIGDIKDTVEVDGIVESNAHAAAIRYAQATYFDLWMAVDIASFSLATGDATIRFDPKLIETNWLAASAFFAALPANDTQALTSRIKRERSAIHAFAGEGGSADDADDGMVQAGRLWPGKFENYRQFKAWLDKRADVRTKRKGQRLLVNAADFATAHASTKSDPDETTIYAAAASIRNNRKK